MALPFPPCAGARCEGGSSAGMRTPGEREERGSGGVVGIDGGETEAHWSKRQAGFPCEEILGPSRRRGGRRWSVPGTGCSVPDTSLSRWRSSRSCFLSSAFRSTPSPGRCALCFRQRPRWRGKARPLDARGFERDDHGQSQQGSRPTIDLARNVFADAVGQERSDRGFIDHVVGGLGAARKSLSFPVREARCPRPLPSTTARIRAAAHSSSGIACGMVVVRTRSLPPSGSSNQDDERPQVMQTKR